MTQITCLVPAVGLVDKCAGIWCSKVVYGDQLLDTCQEAAYSGVLDYCTISPLAVEKPLVTAK
jgi:hypothetical protein